MSREPLTCRRCWEEREVNVGLALVSLGYDNRSVETKFSYVCPTCGHNTGVLAT